MSIVVIAADGGARDIATIIGTIIPTTAYKSVFSVSGSHTAARVAGTYGFGHGDPLAITGVGTLYPLAVMQLVVADFPPVNSVVVKLRLRAQLFSNDVAPTGNFTIGLYPVTRPATSGGAGVCIYTLGTVVPGSTVLFTTPVADSLLNGASSDFTFPTDGPFVIGCVTTAAVAASSHVHLTAQLQMRN